MSNARIQSAPEHNPGANNQIRRRQRTASHLVRSAIKLVPRIVTNQMRMMRAYVIIGAARCGTTSFYEYLTQHPSIAPALRKEV